MILIEISPSGSKNLVEMVVLVERDGRIHVVQEPTTVGLGLSAVLVQIAGDQDQRVDQTIEARIRVGHVSHTKNQLTVHVQREKMVHVHLKDHDRWATSQIVRKETTLVVQCTVRESLNSVVRVRRKNLWAS